MDWIEANAGWLWFVLAAALLGVELLSLDLVFAMVAAGALAGGVAALVGLALPVQLGVFAVVAALTLALVRPAALRRLHPDPAAGASYLDGLVGRRLPATHPVTESAGLLTVDGDTWSARTEPGAPAAAVGQEVTVQRIDGAVLVVRSVPVIDWDAPRS